MSGGTGFWFVCLGAAFGAPARYLVDRLVQSRHAGVMPWGTLAVNVIGSFLAGAVAGASAGHDVPDAVSLALATGFCGALTTYSTFSYETVRLVETGAWREAVGNVAISLAAGMAAVVLGYVLLA